MTYFSCEVVNKKIIQPWYYYKCSIWCRCPLLGPLVTTLQSGNLSILKISNSADAGNLSRKALTSFRSLLAFRLTNALLRLMRKIITVAHSYFLQRAIQTPFTLLSPSLFTNLTIPPTPYMHPILSLLCILFYWQ